MIEDSSSSIARNASSARKELVKARWGILRNALLQGSHQHQQKRQHSIHRFSGYNLLEARPAHSDSFPSESEAFIRRNEKLLTEYHRSSFENLETKNNDGIDQLEIAILAFAACFPKGKCMRIISLTKYTKESFDSVAAAHLSDSWLEPIKHRCQPSVNVWKVSERLEERKEAKDNTSMIAVVTTILVQESSTSTKYQALVYDLDSETITNELNSHETANKANNWNSSSVDGTDISNRHIIWTREPRETRLSLDDLVSHRKNNGVDNTGNICVWDSERTLAYLLYHHFDDFCSGTDSDNESKILIPTNFLDCEETPRLQAGNRERHPVFRILELGTGMAGLSAVAFGLRLAMQRQDKDGENTKEHEKRMATKAIHVTLTDGNPNGVKNNAVNQYLTQLDSLTLSQHNDTYSHYLDLDVKCEKLLWTTDLRIGKDTRSDQDLVLVSDCVHFQNFHAALATTTLRCLRVGASAIFCQPTRGPSLDNFFKLLSTAVSNTDSSGSISLLSLAWMTHPIIERKHKEARLQHWDVYDENLHQPKILVLTKMREIAEDDVTRFVTCQRTYSPLVPSSTEGK